ncbi:hypothetical protein BDV27DRAFT_120500, partial [Aspergillus caelatus]
MHPEYFNIFRILLSLSRNFVKGVTVLIPPPALIGRTRSPPTLVPCMQVGRMYVGHLTHGHLQMRTEEAVLFFQFLSSMTFFFFFLFCCCIESSVRVDRSIV